MSRMYWNLETHYNHDMFCNLRQNAGQNILESGPNNMSGEEQSKKALTAATGSRLGNLFARITLYRVLERAHWRHPGVSTASWIDDLTQRTEGPRTLGSRVVDKALYAGGELCKDLQDDGFVVSTTSVLTSTTTEALRMLKARILAKKLPATAARFAADLGLDSG